MNTKHKRPDIAAEAELLLSFLEDRGLTEAEACEVMRMALQALIVVTEEN